MNINTKYFGEISIENEKQIFFEDGLFGFQENKSFVLLSFDENKNPEEPEEDLMCLQSADEPYLAFVIVNPFAILPTYDPLLLTGEDLDELDSTPEDLLVFYAIAVIHEEMAKSTVNLKCPIVINPKNRKGKQVIFEDDTYSLRHPMWSNYSIEEDK